VGNSDYLPFEALGYTVIGLHDDGVTTNFSNGNAKGITGLRTIPMPLLLPIHQLILEIFSRSHHNKWCNCPIYTISL
jgi:hypothetical protein